MKQLKKPTKRQAQLISGQLISGKRLDYHNWLVERETSDLLVIVSRSGKCKRNIDKEI